MAIWRWIKRGVRNHWIAWRMGPTNPKRRRRRRRIWAALAILTLSLAIFSYVTNPFVRFSLIIDPYKRYSYDGQQLKLEQDSNLLVRDDAFFRRIAFFKSGWHIVGNRFTGGRKASVVNTQEIIEAIHADRFDPNEPYLISGDHFSVLYPRSLGIFYHTILDRRTALNDEDWQRRQLLYLKTTAYALQAYKDSDRLSTTIVPVGPRSVALLNFYAPPSDTMYSLLYALKVMTDERYISRLYPFEVPELTVSLKTQRQAQQLLVDHQASLEGHFQVYWEMVYDPDLGLVRTDLLLSGTKDMAKRQSAFYDNVIAWKTHQLAQELRIIDPNPTFLQEYKQRILDTYWLEEQGYFLEDLSEKGIQNDYYSSDWLIVLMTGFLDPRQSSELQYYQRSLDYISTVGLDRPFGLAYHADPRPDQLHLPVRVFAPAYGSTAIWSHWGMEYIKALAMVSEATGDQRYADRAQEQLDAYTFNINRYGGFPEVYDRNGDFFRQTFYKSVRQTGWIVNFEQARKMVEWASREQIILRNSYE